MEIPAKICSRCHKSKPLYDFTRHKRMFDGFANRCRACVKETSKPTELEIIRKNLPENMTDNWGRI